MTDLDEQLAAVEARTAEETAKTKTLEARADDGHLHKRITNAFERSTVNAASTPARSWSRDSHAELRR